MCGITALLTPNEDEIDIVLNIKQMTDIAGHRGPDDEGYVTFSRHGEFYNEAKAVALGHRRLSIIDLTPLGHQPMSTQDTRYWITYNGEIYNYLEIKQELIARGHQFISQTDTEVILTSYQEWGKSCLSRFNGMFAFIIYDRHTNHFFAARDRFGVKPLYYWESPSGYLAFASEIKQFTILPGWSPSVSRKSAYDFLCRGVTDHTEETMFSGVFQLQGGHYLEGTLIPEEKIHFTINRWYSIPQKTYKGNYQDAVLTFTDLLKSSISLRMRSDVSIGSCLSGGLDSSSIVCHMNKLLSELDLTKNQKTFSAYSEDKRYDESDFIRSVVNRCNVDAYSITPSIDELEGIIPKISRHQDEPYGSTSIFAQWKVFETAKENQVKVILDGQGADEILAGYSPFHGARYYDLFTALKWISLAKEMIRTKRLHGNLNPLSLLFRRILPERLSDVIKGIIAGSANHGGWLDFKRLDMMNTQDVASNFRRGVQDLSYEYIYHMSLPMLLRYEDRNSMAHSIEARTPFLDYRLVEFVYQLPGCYKISNGVTKKILRDSTKDVIPENIRTRMDKIAFTTAEEQWMKQRPALFRRWIEDAVEVSGGVVKDSALLRFDKMVEGKIPYSFLPWRIMSFGHWMTGFSCKFS